MAELAAEGREPEILFWVGCAGSFDSRAQKVTVAFCKILNAVGVDFAILGNEESCTGDPARRAGNEFLFQMQALQNIEVLNMYNVKKMVTACPHCFNTIKNEYPALGGNYEVVHHTQLLQELINEGRIKMKEGGEFKGKRIAYSEDFGYVAVDPRVREIVRAAAKVFESDLGCTVEEADPGWEDPFGAFWGLVAADSSAATVRSVRLTAMPSW